MARPNWQMAACKVGERIIPYWVCHRTELAAKVVQLRESDPWIWSVHNRQWLFQVEYAHASSRGKAMRAALAFIKRSERGDS